MYMSARMFSDCTRAIVRLQQTYVYESVCWHRGDACYQVSSRPAVSAMLPWKPAWGAPASVQGMHMVLQGKQGLQGSNAILGPHPV